MVHFDKLRLSGFKSFVDPTELVIEAGMTGIVGPNGCGKSNLVEALKWVMGETSAKQMRGSEMEDVIFAGAGTERRPYRLCVATVALNGGLSQLLEGDLHVPAVVTRPVGNPRDQPAENTCHRAAVVHPRVGHRATTGCRLDLIDPIAPVLPECHERKRETPRRLEDGHLDRRRPRPAARAVRDRARPRPR